MNAGRLLQGKPAPVPCTPAGILDLLEREGVPLRGTRAVVVGRSDIVGKPMALLLLRRDATVTIAHSKTRDLPGLCREADLLVAAIGRPGFVTGDFVKEGAVLVDVGINRVTTRADLERFFPGDAKRRAAFEKNGSTLVGDCDPGDGVPAGVAVHAGPRRRGPPHDRAPAQEHARPLQGAEGMILKVGLTGGLASGKSTVAGASARTEFPSWMRISSCMICIAKGARALTRSRRPSGRISSRQTARSTGESSPRTSFTIPLRWRASTPSSIRSSATRRRAGSRDLEAKGEALGVVEATLLVETGGRQRFDVLVTVSAPADMRLRRAIRRSGETDPNDFVKRMSAQFSDAAREEVSDIVIRADGTKEELLKRVDELARELKGRAGGS